MKKNLFALLGRKVIMVSIAACTLMMPAGCGGGGGTTNPITAIPDISNFLLQASTAFVAGEQALIHIASSSLGNGTFTVNFSLSGHNTASGSATLTMNGGTGTFTTPVLTSDGPTTVTISSITNSAGGSAAPAVNNTSSMFDSTGLMVATYTPHGGAATAFHATDVTATLAGTLLDIHGVVWTPNLTTIDLTEDYYSGATGAVSFNSNDLSFSGNPTSTFNGSASYGVAGSGGTTSDLSVHGTITINTVSPLLTGSFTYTNQDSSVVAGTFSCKAP